MSDKDVNTIDAKKSNPISIEKYTHAHYTLDPEGKPYAMILNHVLQNISNLEAGFVWAYLQSLPPRWIVNKHHLRKKFHIGERKFKEIMSFLKQSNLIDYAQEKNDKQQFQMARIIVKNGEDFKQVDSKISNVIPDDNLKKSTNTKLSQSEENYPQAGGAISARAETRTCGSEKHINNTYIKNETIKETGSSSSEKEKKALKLLRDKLKDRRITLEQAREVINVHTSKEATLEWSVNNFLKDLENKNDNIKNKVSVLAFRLKDYKLGYYPDVTNYTKDKNDEAINRKRLSEKRNGNFSSINETLNNLKFTR